MSKLTFPDIYDLYIGLIHSRNRPKRYLTKVINDSPRCLILQASEKTEGHGFRVVDSLVINYKDIEGENYSAIVNYYKEICDRHKSLA